MLIEPTRTFHCTNPDCTQNGIDKAGTVVLAPDERVICGTCGEPCELTQ